MMDFGIFAGKLPLPRPSRVSNVGIGLLVACGAAALATGVGQTLCGRADIPGPGSPARVTGDAALDRLILREAADSEVVTHIAVEQESGVLFDPTPADRQYVTTLNPAIRPVSDLFKPAASSGEKGKFGLKTVASVRWESPNRVTFRLPYRSSSGLYTSRPYTAHRFWLAKGGWFLWNEWRGCGGWKTLTVQTDGGKRLSLSARQQP